MRVARRHSLYRGWRGQQALRQEPRQQLPRSRHLPSGWRDLLLNQRTTFQIEAAPSGGFFFGACACCRSKQNDPGRGRGLESAQSCDEKRRHGDVEQSQAGPAELSVQALAAAPSASDVQGLLRRDRQGPPCARPPAPRAVTPGRVVEGPIRGYLWGKKPGPP